MGDVEGGDGTADDLMDAFGFGSDDGGDAPAEAADAPAEPPAGDAKEMRGGLHKFDPDEVDVEGGDATADDLMDAFGFGGDDGAAAEEPAAAATGTAAEAAVPVANGTDADILSIQATSASTVKVALHLGQ